MNDKWLMIDISAPPELTDGIANFLEEIGAAGVFQEAAIETAPQSSPEAVGELNYGCLQACLPWHTKEDSITLLERYLLSLGEIFPDLEQPRFKVREITAPDWAEEWKKYFHPLRIGKQFIVKPTWEKYTPAADDYVIEIDPGMAFGTGQHSSTAMCIEAMEEIYSRNDQSNREVLDVGTGTGILGIAAVRLGASRVHCLDLDEKALEIARSNARLNEVDDKLVVSNLDISSLTKPFNLILANLTAKTLIELRRTLEFLLKPLGYMVISGIIEQNVKDIEACFLRSPLSLWRRINREEWFCYVLKKT